MLDMSPDENEMTALVGKSLYEVWTGLCALIDEKYDADRLWDRGGKAWKYRYRRGGKTLCALYARKIVRFVQNGVKLTEKQTTL